MKIHKSGFDIRTIDPNCNSFLNMKDLSILFFEASFKFINTRDVCSIDFTNMNLNDNQIY